MTNKIFQDMVNSFSDAIGATIGVIDRNGTVIACTDAMKVGDVYEDAVEDLIYGMDCVTVNGRVLKTIVSNGRWEYIVFVDGSGSEAEKNARLLAIAIANVKQYYDEKYGRANFIKNVIIDNILPGDIFLKARELHLSGDVTRVAMIIRTSGKTDVAPYEIIQNLFPDKNKDFVININETDIALIKETKPEIDLKDLEKLARAIIDTLSGEFYIQSVVGIGTAVVGIRELARSYKEAQVAMEVGKVFDNGEQIVRYDHLGIARLLYQLPRNSCEMFLKEVFRKDTLESLDSETLFTIDMFFENNLNVSETARKLFVHRNTLVYRLDKIKKITGLDLRELDHAIVFKVALMVRKYLNNTTFISKF
ncbi:MAG: helix-turn-helix domain-containing protein [Clostridia bacterium]|nr:helix-turn-helix domain-containing protein [Clostridia bacterium]